MSARRRHAPAKPSSKSTTRPHHAWERMKNTAILLLFLSALALTYLTWVFDVRLLEDPSLSWLSTVNTLLRSDALPDRAALIDTELPVLEAAVPVRLVIGDGTQRWGAQNDPSLVNLHFAPLDSFLAAVVRSAGHPTPATRLTYEEAMRNPSLFLEYAYPVTLSLLSDWMSAETPLPSVPVLSLALVEDKSDGTTTMYYMDAETNDVFGCRTTVPYAAPDTEGLRPCHFFWETDATKTEAPDIIIPADLPTLPVFTAAAPAATAPNYTGFLRAVGINPDTNTQYRLAGGTLYYGDGDRTATFSEDGEIRFTDKAVRDASEAPERRSTVAESVETARRICATLSGLTGQASLVYSGLSSDGNTLTVTFDYSLHGGAVKLTGHDHAAVVDFVGDDVSDIALILRQYQTTREETDLSPAWMAVLLDEVGAGVRPAYEDNGSTAVGKWISLSAF